MPSDGELYQSWLREHYHARWMSTVAYANEHVPEALRELFIKLALDKGTHAEYYWTERQSLSQRGTIPSSSGSVASKPAGTLSPPTPPKNDPSAIGDAFWGLIESNYEVELESDSTGRVSEVKTTAYMEPDVFQSLKRELGSDWKWDSPRRAFVRAQQMYARRA